MDGELTAEDRTALRGFLQRSEVRLSTLHRTATALLSGAGVLVLLPALSRDAIVNVASQLIASERAVSDILLTVCVGLVLFSALVVIWLLLVELTRFYFHSNHLSSGNGQAFTTRFALSSLRVPSDELSTISQNKLEEIRRQPAVLEHLFSSNTRMHNAINARISAYPEIEQPTNDASRAAAMSLLAGSRDRTLLEEVAKTEYTLVRHALRIQVIVLRYMKALLVVILSLLLVFALAALETDGNAFGEAALAWMSAFLVIWATIGQFATSAPVRWLTLILRNEGANRAGIRYDSELVKLEKVMSIITTIVSALAIFAGILQMLEANNRREHVLPLSCSLLTLVVYLGFYFAKNRRDQ